tara:strand:+ start:53084 stop:53602 length:519 start_codon:yes stop_codon:yes gene_type:complete
LPSNPINIEDLPFLLITEHQRSTLKTYTPLARFMMTLAAVDMNLLRSLSGNELSLEVAKMATKYGISESNIMAMLAPPSASPQFGEYDPSPQAISNAPVVDNNYKDYTSSAQVMDKSNFRFEYDPTPGVSQRRQNIDQAILCPGCGVALGIPAIRPIKVTCPQCMQETTFSS